MGTPATPLKSTDVYRALGRVMKPWAAGSGFRSQKNGALWSRAMSGGGHLFFWFQCDKYGWRPYGSQFTLEFELSDGETPQGSDMARRVRFFSLLDRRSDVDELLAMQNAVIARCPPAAAGDDVWASHVEPVADYREGADVWMRFHERSDIERWWTAFLEPRFERMLKRFLEGDPVDPSYPAMEAAEVSLRSGSRGDMLLLVPHAVAAGLRQVLGTLERAPPKGLILKAKTGEIIFELADETRVTTCRSAAGKEHRAKCLLTSAALQELVAALERPPSADPHGSQELGELKVWHHGG
ncbi:MAG TPA: hypothetical protein VFB81_13660 [Myxococcales bacterium]|nr:hypothetical protein [Myxococcales bacterium]